MVSRWLTALQWLRRSSTLRLTAVLSVIFALGFIVAIIVALNLGQRAIEDRVDASLDALAQGAEVTDARTDNPAMILRPIGDLAGLPRPFLRAASRGGGTVELGNDLLQSDVWRIRVTKDGGGTPVLIAVPLEESAEILELLAGILWTTAIVVIAAALGIGVWAGLLAQRRLARINATLGQLAAGDLSARSGQKRSMDDLDDIAQNLDRTASEIERLVTQTRHLSASIAHDLRTPLARLQARLEMLPDGEERGAAMEEAHRLSAIFDTIMRVARIEAGRGRDGFDAVALEALANDLAETFGPVVEDAGKALHLDISAHGTIQADRGMLVQALANLIQNAIVHGGDRITLFARGNEIGVSDNGQGVDAAQFDEIIKPMVRLDTARSTQGSGLGLALVRAVADRHGAALDLAPNAPHGLTVTLRFTEL